MSLIGLYAPTLKPSILAAWFVEISEGWMWLRIQFVKTRSKSKVLWSNTI